MEIIGDDEKIEIGSGVTMYPNFYYKEEIKKS